MIILQILAFFPFLLLLFLFFLTLLFCLKKFFYYGCIAILWVLVVVLYKFIFAVGVNYFSLVLLGLWIVSIYLQMEPRSFKGVRGFSCLIGKIQSFEERAEISFLFPLFLLKLINIVPSSWLKKISKDRGDIKEMINLLLKEGKGLSVDIESEEGLVQIYLI